MLKFYFNKRILVGFVLALAILSWLAIASFLHTRNFIRSSHSVARALDVLYNTERVMANAVTIELGQRGYTITGNDEFLRPYRKAKSEIETHLENLKSLTHNSPGQQERITELQRHIRALLDFSFTAIELRKKSFEASRDLNASLQGKKLMDNIRELVASIEGEEKALLQQRSATEKNEVEKFNYTFVGLLISTGVILISIHTAIHVTLKGRDEAEKKLEVVSAEIHDLYDNAPCGYHSLDGDGYFVNINNTLLQWLGYTRDEVMRKMKFDDVTPPEDHSRLNKIFDEFKEAGKIFNVEFNFVRKDGSQFPVSLNSIAIQDAGGKYIKSRSTTFDLSERKQALEQIKTLNRELEAFTYSVSHDLRAPLRSIDGYAKILQEDYIDKVDDEGKRVIQVIINNAHRMGKLIDNLLDFSRLGRKEITLAEIHMTEFVKNIAQELTELERDRSIAVTINPLLQATVDPDMIRQVWINLLSNAIKYTGKTADPRIEVDSFETETEIGYWVKDNGVGFDMRYVSKLFGVFQRLHKIQDFSGTGVGLAIVKRIIDRHQGRVWAEGKVNGGASFYFTIPKK